MATKKEMATKRGSNGANLGFEQKLWQAADKLRSNMDAAEYKHVVLGLIFLKYISDAFTEAYNEIKQDELADPIDKDEYIARRVFWVPQEARWEYLQENVRKLENGEPSYNQMDLIEGENLSLKRVLPKNYARPVLKKLYPNIDIVETLSNLKDKWIKKINTKDLDYKLIKPLIWWE